MHFVADVSVAQQMTCTPMFHCSMTAEQNTCDRLSAAVFPRMHWVAAPICSSHIAMHAVLG